MLYRELFAKRANSEACPVNHIDSIFDWKLVHEQHEPVAGIGIGYVEIKHDIVYAQCQIVIGTDWIVIFENVDSPFLYGYVLKIIRLSLLDMG